VGLLVQMMVVGVWVVKAPDLHLSEEGSVPHEDLTLRMKKWLALSCNTPYHIDLLIVK
jgi:hypothetical protein